MGKKIHAEKEAYHKKSVESAEKSKEGARKQHVKMTAKEGNAKEAVTKVADQEKSAKEAQDRAGEKMEDEQKAEEKTKKSDESKLQELDTSKGNVEKEDKAEESAKRKIERSQKEIQKAPDDASWQEAKQKRKDAKTVHENAVADEAAAKAKIEHLKTKESEAKALVKDTAQAAADALKEEEKHKADIKEHMEKEKVQKGKVEKGVKAVEEEKEEKEGNAKKRQKELDEKAHEKKVKQAEVTAKGVEKKVKENEAEKLVKEGKKKALWAEQSKKEKKVKESETKERKKKADCQAKQELEQMQIRFTIAEDRAVELGTGWQNFGNNYEGLRLQKQGNLCLLSGLIRVGEETISTGSDKGKKFWHAMETLIQTGESSMNTPAVAGQWGDIASIGNQCKPNTMIELAANNHAEISKITIDKDGVVKWKSGGSRHGWISLSGVMWKAGGVMDGNIDGVPEHIASVMHGTVTFANGWKGEGVSVYRQGNICAVLGQTYGGRNFQGRVMTLPTNCRPKRKYMFAFSHGKQSFRVDVDVDGAVVPYKVPDSVEKYLNLQTIIFPVVEGTELELHNDRGWRPSSKFPPPQAYRQGALCVLSGVAYNGDIRSGIHSLLKHSGSPAVLPEWCIPRHRMAFTVISTEGKVQRVDVLDDGSIRWIAGQREKYMNLVGIRFDIRADLVQKFSESLLKVSKCEE